MSERTTPVAAVGVLDVVAFVAELLMIGGLAVAGWSLGHGWVISLVVAVLLPLVAAAVWGLWCAPRAVHRLSRLPRWAVKVALFSGTLLLMLAADPRPLVAAAGLLMWLAFLVSLPADRGA
jgi:hypothetical protein